MHGPLPWNLADIRTPLDLQEVAWAGAAISLHDILRLTAGVI
jgi:hypothetical protein